jgi:hypothetical protein
LVAVFGLALATPGVLLLIQSPTGGARTYVGFSALLLAATCYLLGCLRFLGLYQLFAFGFAALTVFPLTSFTASYANALKTQKDYEAHIANLLGDDLSQLQQTKEWQHLTLVGDVGFAPALKGTYFRKYPVLASLIPIDLRSDASGGFGNTVLRFHGTELDKYSRAEDRNSVIQQATADKLVKTGSYYEIYALDGNLVIRLKPNF